MMLKLTMKDTTSQHSSLKEKYNERELIIQCNNRAESREERHSHTIQTKDTQV